MSVDLLADESAAATVECRSDESFARLILQGLAGLFQTRYGDFLAVPGGFRELCHRSLLYVIVSISSGQHCVSCAPPLSSKLIQYAH